MVPVKPHAPGCTAACLTSATLTCSGGRFSSDHPISPSSALKLILVPLALCTSSTTFWLNTISGSTSTPLSTDLQEKGEGDAGLPRVPQGATRRRRRRAPAVGGPLPPFPTCSSRSPRRP